MSENKKGFFKDHEGNFSSKRLLSIVGGFAFHVFCWALMFRSPDQIINIIWPYAGYCAVCAGVVTVDQLAKIKGKSE